MDYQVIVVGGGPVGMGLAIDLGLRGVSCALVEKEASLHRIPKGQNLTQRTMEHLRIWGVEAEVRAARLMPSDYPTDGITAYGTLMGPYSYRWYRRDQVRPFYFADNERLPQYQTEAVLRERVSGLSEVDTFFGWRADGLDETGGAAEVMITSAASGERRALRARYIVGCDGSRSFVRDASGIGEDRSEHDRMMVLIVFRSRRLHELLERFDDASFFNVLNPSLDGYWQFLGRVDVGEEWFFHAPVPEGTTPDNDEITALLHRAVGAEFPVEYEYVGFWDLRIAIADRYQSSRVLIAGDAAHSHPPYGGYGINTGLEDARNLGWKLAARLEGWAADSLVTTYVEERRPVFASTARDFIETFIADDRAFLARYDPDRDRIEFEAAWDDRASGSNVGVSTFEPHYEGSSIVFGPRGGVTSARGSHEPAARPGHHLPPVPLSDGRDLFEQLGTDFSLIALGADEDAIGDFAGAALTMGIPLNVIRDTFDGGREAYRSHLVLVRPDHYVAWTGDGRSSPAEHVLGRAIGQRSSRSVDQ